MLSLPSSYTYVKGHQFLLNYAIEFMQVLFVSLSKVKSSFGTAFFQRASYGKTKKYDILGIFNCL